ncbi:hypothetical protein ACLKA6_018757 [Drosophila palustris]
MDIMYKSRVHQSLGFNNAKSGSRPDTGISMPSQSISTATKSVKSTIRSGGTGSDNVPSITKEINSGILSMKKGFSSFMTSIDSAIKSGTPNDDASDTFSMQSDISSDSENFAIVMGDDKTMDCMDASPVEVASEVYEEPSSYKTNMSSPSEPSEASTWRRRDLVSMATFRLTTVEVIRQQEGPKSSVRLQVAAVSCDECAPYPGT